MGSVIGFMRRLLLTVTSCVCILITLYNVSNVSIDTDGLIYLVDYYTDTYHETISDNVCLTTVNGLSNICIKLKNDGYEVYACTIEKDFIDISLVKDNSPTYRLYLTYPECRLTIFSSEYENAYILQSYINVREK